jgi:hypothetical protein
VKWTPPERLSRAVQQFWAIAAVGCAGMSLGYVIVDDASSALSVAGAGVAFWWLSHYGTTIGE